MRRMILWLAVLLCVAAAPLAPTGDFSKGTSTATSSNSARSLADRANDIGVNIMDYGAKCDDSTNDAASINAATSILQAQSTNTAGTLIFPAGKTCKITSPVNLTGLQGQYVTVMGNGAKLDCQMSGGVCLDALGSRYLRIQGLTIIALNGSAVPAIGIQIGRTNNAASNSSDNQVFRDVLINGSFSEADVYNFSSETTLFDNVRLYNSNASGSAYCLIQDGYNHFNAQSTFITENAATDTAQSFNEDTFISLDLRNSGGGSALWMGNTSRHRYVGSYIGNTSGTGSNSAVILYGESGGNNTMLDFDVHIESVSVVNDFLVSGTNTTPIINGFKYRDHSTSASNAILKADTTQTSVTLRDAQFEIGTYASTGNLLDTIGHAASIWTFVGSSYWSAAITQFNAANWQGSVQAAQSGTMAGLYGANLGGISAQYPDGTTAGGNARGANAVDWQQVRTANSQIAGAANSTIGGGTGNQAGGANATVAGGSANFATQIDEAIGGGSGNALSGTATAAAGGLNGNDHGVGGTELFAAGQQTSGNAAQWAISVLRGTTTSGSTLILTSTNAGSTSASNCANMPVNKQYSFVAMLNGHDTTAPATKSFSASWGYGAGGPHILSIGPTIGNAVIDGVTTTITPDGSRSIGTLTGIGATIQADTSSGCPKAIVTPPTSTTDTWEWTLVIERAE